MAFMDVGTEVNPTSAGTAVEPSTPAPVAGTPVNTNEVVPLTLPEGDMGPAFDEILSSLPDNQKAFIAEYATPELALLMGVMFGDSAKDYFASIADESKVLVPMSQAHMRELQDDVTAAQATTEGEQVTPPSSQQATAQLTEAATPAPTEVGMDPNTSEQL